MKKSTFRQHRTEAQCDDTDPAGIFLRYRKRSLRDADAGTTDSVTDDAMVVEQMLNHPIRLVYGSYENIKITTPEDLEMAEVFLKRRKK